MFATVCDAAFVLSLWIGLFVSILIYISFWILLGGTLVMLVATPVYLLVHTWI